MVRALVAALVAVAAVTACTAGGASAGAAGGPTGTTATGGPAVGTAAAGSIPSTDLALIQATIAAINATAGGPVTAQRSVLDGLAAPDQAADQRSCPAARSTLAFQPAYGDLRRAPEAAAAGGSAAPGMADGTAVTGVTGSTDAAAGSAQVPSGGGARYLLPVFITIYTGDRITGTDMTTLRLWILSGTARTAALCVS